MKKKFINFVFVFLVLVLASCAPMGTATMAAVVSTRQEGVVYSTSAPSAIPTATMTPTATVDTKATEQNLQAQLDEKQRQLDEMKRHEMDVTLTVAAITQSAADQQFALEQWKHDHPTSTPVPTWTPDISATKAKLALDAGELTMAKEAPTQLNAMSNAMSNAKTADSRANLLIFFGFVACVFLLSLAYFVFLKARQQTQVMPMAEQFISEAGSEANHFGKTVMTAVNEDRTVAKRLVWPCNKEKLTWFAQCVLDGRTLAVNQWEKKGDLGQRKILEIRAFLRLNNLVTVKPATGGRKGDELLPTPYLLSILHGWLNDGQLPHGHEVLPMDDPNTMNSDHAHENHGQKNGGGGVISSNLDVAGGEA